MLTGVKVENSDCKPLVHAQPKRTPTPTPRTGIPNLRSSAMMHQSGPLWHVVEDVYGPESMMEGYSRPFSSLYRLAVELEATGSTFPVKPKAKSLSLTSTQTRSFWMLWRWWGTYQKACLMAIENPAAGLCVHLVAGLRYQLNVDSRQFLNGLTLFEREFGGPLNVDSGQFLSGLSLFEDELSGLDMASEIGGLETSREEMAIHSSCQHIALASYMQLGTNRNESLNYPIHSADFIDQDSEEVFKSGRRILQEHELSGLDPRCSTGASIIARPWLGDTSGLPFFLWDVAAKEVVEVSTLPPNIEYTAISHTWGRWSKDTPIHVPGVKEWAVPQNTIFDVKDLPFILARVPTSTQYIWFDLVCIPQDHSPKASQEISRQAQIFRRAKHAIVWLNQFGSWKGVEEALDWMSLVYLGVDQPTDANIRNMATHLFGEYTHEPGVARGSMEISGWFSSLWTLREICLRPDMWLCNAEWTLLQVGKGTPVAFNSVVALAQECVHVLEERVSLEELSDYPGMAVKPQFNPTRDLIDPENKFGTLIQYGKYQRGFLEPVELFDRTGMRDLHVMRRDTILLLGSERYCEGSREEAIMAVLGATNWSSSPPSAMELKSDKASLVLGQYPLAFVQHIATALGPTFFNSISTSSSAVDFAEIVASAPQLSKGSLLPFGQTQMASQEKKLLLNWTFFEEINNPAVQTWKIKISGSIHIPMAAIMASTTDADMQDVIANVWLTYDAGPYNEPDPRFSLDTTMRRFKTVNLKTWATEYYPFSKNFAVELIRSNGCSRGVLLKEIKWGPKELVKVGNYIVSSMNHPRNTPDEHLPITKQVDWMVI